MVQYRDPGPIVFAAVIERPDGPGAYVTFPFSAVDLFGVRARVPVKARFDDTVEYRGLSDVGACCRPLDAAHRHRYMRALGGLAGLLEERGRIGKRCQGTDDTFATITPHDLRHTAANLAVSAHANVKAVQRMLAIYADLFDEDLDEVAGRLDAAIQV